jgi:hypothetical protein
MEDFGGSLPTWKVEAIWVILAAAASYRLVAKFFSVPTFGLTRDGKIFASIGGALAVGAASILVGKLLTRN